MTDIAELRADVDAWVTRTYPGGTYFDKGGQRLIYRLSNENDSTTLSAQTPTTVPSGTSIETSLVESDATIT